MSDFTRNREMRWMDAVGMIVLFPILLLMVAFDKYWEWDGRRRERMTTKHNHEADGGSSPRQSCPACMKNHNEVSDKYAAEGLCAPAQPEASPEPQSVLQKHGIPEWMWPTLIPVVVAYAAVQNAALTKEVERLLQELSFEKNAVQVELQRSEAAESRLRAREEEIARLQALVQKLLNQQANAAHDAMAKQIP